VVEKAEALGMSVLQNDPPRQRAENDDLSFVDLDTLLENSDIVTTHVPMTKEGVDKTLHLADAGFFGRMKPGSIFINAARGAVVKSDDLIAAIKSGHIAHTVLDTWEGEPRLREDLLPLVDIATPHIAGHSFEGKVAGTVMVYRDACRFLGIEATWTPDALLPPPQVPVIAVDSLVEGDNKERDESVVWQAVKQLYNIEGDDGRLRVDTSDRSVLFDSLRKSYPIRREFRFTKIKIKRSEQRLCNIFEKLGFRVEPF
jgi:erythronate-4-phosphate dehydrogenase